MAMLRKLTGEQKRTVAHWAMELVIVVAGVLIALWVQQWADRRRALDDMAAAEQAIHEEVRYNLTTLIWREAIAQCHVERAQLLKSMLLASGTRWPGITDDTLLRNKLSEATGIQIVVPGVYQRPYDDISMSAWETALATGALAPMDRKRFGQLVALYNQFEFLKLNRDREDAAAAALSALSLPQVLTPDSRTRMFEALYRVDTSRFLFKLNGAANVAAQMKDLGWNDRQEIERYIVDGLEADRKRGVQWRPCVQRERNPFAEPAS
jgi:hypothetical protein